MWRCPTVVPCSEICCPSIWFVKAYILGWGLCSRLRCEQIYCDEPVGCEKWIGFVTVWKNTFFLVYKLMTIWPEYNVNLMYFGTEICIVKCVDITNTYWKSRGRQKDAKSLHIIEILWEEQLNGFDGRKCIAGI